MGKDFAPLFTWRSAICDSDLPSTTRLVALALSLHMNERGGSAYPSAPLLARETGLGVSTVREHRTRLETEGWIVCVERGGLKGGARRASAYEAQIPTPPAAVPVQETALTPPAPGADPSSNRTPVLHRGHQEVTIGSTVVERKRDLVFEAVCEVTGVDWTQLTGSARGWVGKAVKQIKEAGGTPEEVRRRGAEYRVRFKDAALTPTALAKHWPTLTGNVTTLAGGQGAIARATARARSEEER